jgi:hypothetical protein
LNRQSQRFKCEGIDLGVSTLADRVGAGVFAAMGSTLSGVLETL